MDPFEAELRQRKLLEAGGTGGHGVNGRTHIVQITGQSERGRARTAANFLRGFVHGDGDSGACQQDGRGQSIGAGADDYGARLVRNSQRRLF